MNILKSDLYKRSREKAAVAIPRSIWTNPIHFIACGFGAGLLPWVPGTWGTLVAIPIYFILIQFPLWFYITITVLFNIAGIWLCGVTNRDFGTDDHPAAVWDEIAAFLIVLIAVPPKWYYIAIGFVLFRIFDIWKPWPIRWVDKNVHGGFGVMLDDIIAAIFAFIILRFIILLIH